MALGIKRKVRLANDVELSANYLRKMRVILTRLGTHSVVLLSAIVAERVAELDEADPAIARRLTLPVIYLLEEILDGCIYGE